MSVLTKLPAPTDFLNRLQATFATAFAKCVVVRADGKTIAPGGLGIGRKLVRTVGTGKGQLTLGSVIGYEPRYAEDGSTILGWVPLYAATVNS